MNIKPSYKYLYPKYKFIRYEALEKNPERSVNLKELVDKKLSCLENKIDSEKVDQNV